MGNKTPIKILQNLNPDFFAKGFEYVSERHFDLTDHFSFGEEMTSSQGESGWHFLRKDGGGWSELNLTSHAEPVGNGFADKVHRAFRKYIGTGRTMATCKSACSGYKYFAMQNGHECFCENDFARGTRYGEKVCNGNGLGGSWCNDVYRLTYYWEHPPAAGNLFVSSSSAAVPPNAGVKMRWVAPKPGVVHIKGHVQRKDGPCNSAVQEVAGVATCAAHGGADKVTTVAQCAAGAARLGYGDTSPDVVRDDDGEDGAGRAVAEVSAHGEPRRPAVRLLARPHHAFLARRAAGALLDDDERRAPRPLVEKSWFSVEPERRPTGPEDFLYRHRTALGSVEVSAYAYRAP